MCPLISLSLQTALFTKQVSPSFFLTLFRNYVQLVSYLYQILGRYLGSRQLYLIVKKVQSHLQKIIHKVLRPRLMNEQKESKGFSSMDSKRRNFNGKSPWSYNQNDHIVFTCVTCPSMCRCVPIHNIYMQLYLMK